MPAHVTSSDDKLDLIFKRLNIMEADMRKVRDEQMKPPTNPRVNNFLQERKFQPRQFSNGPIHNMTCNGRPICHYCRQPGHVQANCFKHLQNQGISNQTYRSHGFSARGLNPSARPWQPSHQSRNCPQAQDPLYHAASIESLGIGYLGEQHYLNREVHNTVGSEPSNAPYQAFVGSVSSAHIEPSMETCSVKEEEDGYIH